MNSIPVSEVLLLLLIGGVLHLFVHLVSSYVVPVLQKRRPTLSYLWNRLQVILWVLYVVITFSVLFRANMYLTLAISALALVLGWSFLINFFAGIAIKFTNQFKIGDQISTELAEGKIQAIKISFTEIINGKGELIVVPNTLLRNAVLKHISQKNKLSTSTFNFSCSQSYSQVYQHAINCPFISGNQDISVVKKDHNSFEVKAMLLDDSYAEEAITYFECIDK